MRWILELLVRYRAVAAAFLASVVSIWMIASPAAVQAKTARFLALTFFYPLQVAFSQASKAGNIYAENRRLNQEVTRLNARVSELEDQKAENDRLRKMIDFKERLPYSIVPAGVIARDPSPVVKSVVVSAGASMGILPYMPVVGESGIAGKVVQVMPFLSLVQLLADPVNKTSVLVKRTRAVSIMETEDGREFSARFRVHEEVAAGDTLVTSGQGGIYPRGFPAGIVVKVVDEGDRLFKRAVVVPVLGIDRCEELFIVRQPPQWAALRAQLETLQRSR